MYFNFLAIYCFTLYYALQLSCNFKDTLSSQFLTDRYMNIIFEDIIIIFKIYYIVNYNGVR